MFRPPTRLEPEPVETAPEADDAASELAGALDEATAAAPGLGPEEPPSALDGRILRPLDEEERERIRRDPTVRRVLEAFDGIIVSMQRQAVAPPGDEPTESGETETSVSDGTEAE